MRTATANLVLPLQYSVGFLNGLSECHPPNALQPGQLEICFALEQQGLNSAPLLKTVEPVYWSSPLQADTCAPTGVACHAKTA